MKAVIVLPVYLVEYKTTERNLHFTTSVLLDICDSVQALPWEDMTMFP